MNLSIATRIARRELRGGLGGFRIFILCLTLGVAAIAAVGSVRAAIEAGLQREGARLLGGDAEMQFTYRYATEDERAFMDGIATEVSQCEVQSPQVDATPTPNRKYVELLRQEILPEHLTVHEAVFGEVRGEVAEHVSVTYQRLAVIR